MSTPDEYWMAESILEGTLGETVNSTRTTRVWAVGHGDQEIAWFINRDDALAYKTFCNAAVAAAKAKEQP